MFRYSITLDSLCETNSNSNYCVKSCIELSIFIWSNIFVSLSFPQLILFKFTPCTQILTLFSSDINECLVDPSPCDDNAACANTEGSYACTCEEGYTGNGTYCQGNVYCILILYITTYLNCWYRRFVIKQDSVQATCMCYKFLTVYKNLQHVTAETVALEK